MSAPAWNAESLATLRKYAAARLAVSEIASLMGRTVASVYGKCLAEGIDIIRYTAAELEARIERKREWERRRTARKRKKRQADRAKGVFVAPNVRPGTSKTSRAYREMLPRLPDLTRAQKYEMLRQAVLNTGATA